VFKTENLVWLCQVKDIMAAMWHVNLPKKDKGIDVIFYSQDTLDISKIYGESAILLAFVFFEIIVPPFWRVLFNPSLLSHRSQLNRRNPVLLQTQHVVVYMIHEP